MDIHVWGCIENDADRGLLHPSRKRCATATPNNKENGMKRNFFRMLVVSFGAAALAIAAYAADLDRLVVDIPYDFVVNGKTLPAGKYNVKRNSDHDLLVLAITSVDDRASAVTLTQDI